VYNSVRYPRQNVENSVFVCGQDVTQIRTVEDVLEGGQDADPDGGSEFAGNISRRITVSVSSSCLMRSVGRCSHSTERSRAKTLYWSAGGKGDLLAIGE
jgi:hypothetical protein